MPRRVSTCISAKRCDIPCGLNLVHLNALSSFFDDLHVNDIPTDSMNFDVFRLFPLSVEIVMLSSVCRKVLKTVLRITFVYKKKENTRNLERINEFLYAFSKFLV